MVYPVGETHTKIRESRYENYKDWKPSQPIEK